MLSLGKPRGHSAGGARALISSFPRWCFSAPWPKRQSLSTQRKTAANGGQGPRYGSDAALRSATVKWYVDPELDHSLESNQGPAMTLSFFPFHGPARRHTGHPSSPHVELTLPVQSNTVQVVMRPGGKETNRSFSVPPPPASTGLPPVSRYRFLPAA